MSLPTPNADETLQPEAQKDALFIGNFHKTLPHNEYGEVKAEAYRAFRQICLDIDAGEPIDFERVQQGFDSYPPPGPPFQPQADVDAKKSGAKFTSPLAGAATELLGPDPESQGTIIRNLTRQIPASVMPLKVRRRG